MYAIVETSGKQYRVEPGLKLVVDLVNAEEGATVTLDKVLLVGGDSVKVGGKLGQMGFTGAGVGAAMTGLRPIVDLTFIDLVGCAYDQIANQAAKMHYMMGGKVELPLVIRTAYGTRGDKRSYG